MADPITASLYVDAQHLYHAARAAGRELGRPHAKPDYDGILTHAAKGVGRVAGIDWRQVEFVERRIYTVSRNRAKAFEHALGRIGYSVQSYLLRSDSDAFDWDVQIAVDAMHDTSGWLDAQGPCDDAKHVVVVVSGDGDFVPLMERLESYEGVSTIALGFEGRTSTRFPRAASLPEACLYGGE